MKKIFILMFCMVFLIGNVMALDWDNKLTYEKGLNGNPDLKVDLKNWFGLGTDYGTAELKSHKSVTEIKQVGFGKEVVMYYDFNFNELYKNGLGTPEFTDMKTGKNIEREWKFVYWGTEEYESPVYSEVSTINGTIYEQTGTETRTRETWLPYNSKDIPKGNIRIGIEVESFEGDYIDGVWEIGGKKVSRHATWTAALNTNLKAYYNFEDTSSLLIDVFNGNYNGTKINTPANTTGLIGNGNSFTAGDNDYYNFTSSIGGTGVGTWNGWVNVTDTGIDTYFMGAYSQLGKIWLRFREGNFGGGIYVPGETLFASNSTTNLANNTKHMITVVFGTGGLQLWENGVLVATDVTAQDLIFGSWNLGGRLTSDGSIASGTAGTFGADEIGIWERRLTEAEITQLYNSGAGLTYVYYAPAIDIFSPTNATYTNPTLYFNASTTQTVTNWIVNYNGTNVTLGSINSTLEVEDGFHHLLMYADGTEGMGFNDSVYFTMDTSPQITIFTPENSTYIDSILYFNASSSQSVDTWIVNYNGTNITNFNINTTLDVENGFHHLLIYANNSATGIIGLNDTIYFTRTSSTTNTFNYDAFVYETSNGTFWTNITTNGSSITNPKLIWNSSTYDATSTNLDGNYYNVSSSIQIPNGTTGNATVYFNYTIGGVSQNSTQHQQNVGLTYFTLCNGTYTTPFINYTFQDEADLSTINATIPSSTFYYWLGTGTLNKSITYSNANPNYNYTFCGTPNQTMYVDYEIQYASTGYPQRIYSETTSYNNTMGTKILYLLATADGIYVTFQVINSAEQTIQGVIVNATRSVSGVDTLVGSGTTGADGGVTLWLNPDFLHTFMFVKTGYTSLITSLFPTQSSYTITLGGGSGDTPLAYDYSRGISYVITPTSNSLVNNTIYNFSFTLTSSYWDVTDFGFILVNSTSNTINSTNALTNGGSVYVMHNTTDETKIKMNYYWVINSTYNNASKSWIIYDSGGTSWSISAFFVDLSSYTSSGLFGLDDFGISIIIFIIIFITTGFFSYRYGLTNHASIMGIAFTLTLFFNVGINIIPLGESGLRYFPTVIMALIFIATLIREVAR